MKTVEAPSAYDQRPTCFASTFRCLVSILFPTNTIGMFSQTREISRCQFGTLLYVMREVTSNMMIAACPWMLHARPSQSAILARIDKPATIAVRINVPDHTASITKFRRVEGRTSSHREDLRTSPIRAGKRVIKDLHWESGTEASTR